MAGQANDLRTLNATEHRALASVPVDRIVRRHRDAVIMMPGTLFAIDPNWYDNYWYGERPDQTPGRIGKVVRQLWARLSATRQRRSTSRSRQPDQDPVVIPAGE